MLGISGAKPNHLLEAAEREKPFKLNELAVDVGTTSREETEALGVRVGHLITFAREGALLNGTRVFTGKAVDDRAGCAVMIEVMRRLSSRSATASVVGVAAVQEELGIRGAGPAGFRVQPDVALAIDVTLCGDVPGVDFGRAPIKLGGGPAIKYFDWAPEALIGNAVPRRLTNRLEQAADGAGIAYQREVLMGGATDAWAISLSGRGVLSGLRVAAVALHPLGRRLRPPGRPGGRRRADPRLHRRRHRPDRVIERSLRRIGPVEMPVIEARGSQDGPTRVPDRRDPRLRVRVDGGADPLHGRLDTDALRGSIVAAPIVNVTAFRGRSPFVTPEDGKNLNRCFPGRADGTHSDQLAHHVFTELISGSDLLIDLHGGDLVEALEPFTLFDASPVADRAEALARAYGLRYVIRGPATQRIGAPPAPPRPTPASPASRRRPAAAG